MGQVKSATREQDGNNKGVGSPAQHMAFMLVLEGGREGLGGEEGGGRGLGGWRGQGDVT